MIRAVLARDPDYGWKLFRQPQWMAIVRRQTAAAQWDRSFWDIPDQDFAKFLELLPDWKDFDRTDLEKQLQTLGVSPVMTPE